MSLFLQHFTRVETESGSIYQLCTNVYADATVRTLMQRIPGEGPQAIRIDETVHVLKAASPRIGNPMAITYEDPWEDVPVHITTTPVKGIRTWSVCR
jgi:hypothetical protein